MPFLLVPRVVFPDQRLHLFLAVKVCGEEGNARGGGKVRRAEQAEVAVVGGAGFLARHALLRHGQDLLLAHQRDHRAHGRRLLLVHRVEPGVHHLHGHFHAALRAVKAQASEDVDLRIFPLGFHRRGFVVREDGVFHQVVGVADAARGDGRHKAVVRGVGDAGDLQLHAVFHRLPQLFGVPVDRGESAQGVLLIQVAGQDHGEAQAHQVLIGIADRLGGFRLFAGQELGEHGGNFLLVPQAQGIEHQVAQVPALAGHQHDLVVSLRHPAADHVPGILLRVLELKEGVQVVEARHPVHAGHAAHGRQAADVAHDGAARHLVEEGAGIHLQDAAARRIRVVDPQGRQVLIFHAAEQALRFVRGFQPFPEGGQVVFADLRHHVVEHFPGHVAGVNAALLPFAGGPVPDGGHHGEHDPGGVHRFRFDGQRVLGHGVPLHGGDEAVHAGGQGQDQRDADDTDAARERDQQRPPLLGHQVVQGEAQGRREAHGGFARLRRGGFPVLPVVGIRVADDAAVQQAHGTGRVPVRQFAVMGDHDHEPVAGDLLQHLHDLHAGFAVQGAGGLVRQDDLRIVHQGTGDRDALHLAAAHLPGLFLQLVPEADALERLPRALFALGSADAAERQGELHVGQDRLVRDQVVALEHKADRMVAIGVPVVVGESLCGFSVDEKIAFGVAVEAADDVEHRGFSAARGAENGNKLALAEIDADVIHGADGGISRHIVFDDIFQYQHVMPPGLLVGFLFLLCGGCARRRSPCAARRARLRLQAAKARPPRSEPCAACDPAQAHIRNPAHSRRRF